MPEIGLNILHWRGKAFATSARTVDESHCPAERCVAECERAVPFAGRRLSLSHQYLSNEGVMGPLQKKCVGWDI